jgi:hypothetical protein
MFFMLGGSACVVISAPRLPDTPFSSEEQWALLQAPAAAACLLASAALLVCCTFLVCRDFRRPEKTTARGVPYGLISSISGAYVYTSNKLALNLLTNDPERCWTDLTYYLYWCWAGVSLLICVGTLNVVRVLTVARGTVRARRALPYRAVAHRLRRRKPTSPSLCLILVSVHITVASVLTSLFVCVRGGLQRRRLNHRRA